MDVYYDPLRVHKYGWKIREPDVEKFRRIDNLYVVVAMMYDGFEHCALDITSEAALQNHGEMMESGRYKRVQYYRVAIRYKNQLPGARFVIGPIE